jgi:signal transduction histidine kinase/DNA-binding response OmpR family regulator
LTAGPLYGQQNGLNFTSSDSKDGLSSITDLHLTKDRYGLMWMWRGDGKMVVSGAAREDYPIRRKPNIAIIVLRVMLTGMNISNVAPLPCGRSVFNAGISGSREMAMDYKQNFAADFIAENYERLYHYFCNRFDKGCTVLGDLRSKFDANLIPNTHIFHSFTENIPVKWPYKVASTSIDVNYSFWRTQYAYIAYALLVIAAIIWKLHNNAIKNIERKYDNLQEQARLQQIIDYKRIEFEHSREIDLVKTKFLTDLSHELRTPISLIIGPVEEMIAQHPDGPSPPLEMVRRNARRLLNLVDELSDYRILEQGEMRLNLSNGDIVAFMREVSESFIDIADRKKINFLIRTSMESFYTSFDMAKMERILFNILSNAFKFTPQGGSVELYIMAQEVEGNGVRIRIVDSGIGVDADLREKIFEPFYKAVLPNIIINRGIGIGLSITKEFILLHKGNISVRDNPKGGTIFTVDFPMIRIRNGFRSVELLVSEVSPATMHRVKEQKKDKKIEGPDILSVLIVEDNDDFRFFLKDKLSAYYRISEASNGQEGWKTALAIHPQIILSDVAMPYMDGLEFAKKIRADKRTSHIPIIMITSLNAQEDHLRGLDTGANDYITKPIDFDILKIKIRNLSSLIEIQKNTYRKQISTPDVGSVIVSENDKFLKKVVDYIEVHLASQSLSVEAIREHMNMSRISLYRKIVDLTGETPVEFIRSVRLQRACAMLTKSDMNIAQIGYSVGFGSPNYFSRAFKSKFNILPSEYVQQAKRNR